MCYWYCVFCFVFYNKFGLDSPVCVTSSRPLHSFEFLLLILLPTTTGCSLLLLVEYAYYNINVQVYIKRKGLIVSLSLSLSRLVSVSVCDIWFRFDTLLFYVTIQGEQAGRSAVIIAISSISSVVRYFSEAGIDREGGSNNVYHTTSLLNEQSMSIPSIVGVHLSLPYKVQLFQGFSEGRVLNTLLSSLFSHWSCHEPICVYVYLRSREVFSGFAVGPVIILLYCCRLVQGRS